MSLPLSGPQNLVQVDADIQIKFSHPEGAGSIQKDPIILDAINPKRHSF